MTTFHVEANKMYRDRTGNLVRIVATDLSKQVYIFVGSNGHHYSQAGRIKTGRTMKRDLVEAVITVFDTYTDKVTTAESDAFVRTAKQTPPRFYTRKQSETASVSGYDDFLINHGAVVTPPRFSKRSNRVGRAAVGMVAVMTIAGLIGLTRTR